MADFLLVHGAWHGAWCWQKLTPILQRAGHRVHAVTLTGVGERAHLLHPGITLETHIEDVRRAWECEELMSPALVVHSYAGMIGTALADRFGEELGHVVYVDAVVPKPGESWSSTHASATREGRIAAARANDQFSFPPPDPSVFGLIAEDYAWVRRRQTAHPGGTYESTLAFAPARVGRVRRTFVDCTQPPLATIDVIRRRVRDPRFWDGAWARGARLRELATGHDPMISAPAALAEVLLECSDDTG